MSGRPHLGVQNQSTASEKFLAQAADLPSTWQYRLFDQTIENMESVNLFFDIHAHCFTFQNVPNNFTRLQLIKVPHRFFLSRFYKLIGRLVKEPDRGILAFFSVGAYYNSTLITKKLLKSYSNFFRANQQEKHFVVVMLSMNMEYAISQDIPENHERQMKDLARTCQYFFNTRNANYSASIIPFVGLDPNNKNTYELFLKAFSQAHYRHPIFGIKIYPTLGYLPSHPVLMDVFQVAEQKQIPITTHCGGEATKTDANNVDIQSMQIDDQGAFFLKEEVFSFKKSGDFEAFFNGPDRWRPVLTKYPKLRLNIAHFGSSAQWENYLTNPLDPNTHVFQCLKLVAQYENVFADISYTYFDKAALSKIRDLMIANPTYRQKFLFGSDYYMVLNENDLQSIMVQFYAVFKGHQDLIQALTVENPKRFLFPKD